MKAALAILADLNDQELAEFAERLAPHLTAHLSERLLTPAEAAAQLAVHPKTLVRAAADQRVTGAVRVGHGWRFRASELELLPATPTTPSASAPTIARPRHSDAGTAAVDAIRGRKGFKR